MKRLWKPEKLGPEILKGVLSSQILYLTHSLLCEKPFFLIWQMPFFFFLQLHALSCSCQFLRFKLGPATQMFYFFCLSIFCHILLSLRSPWWDALEQSKTKENCKSHFCMKMRKTKTRSPIQELLRAFQNCLFFTYGCRGMKAIYFPWRTTASPPRPGSP